jgi:hypothetical protein
MRPGLAVRQWFMALQFQAFIDESESGPGGEFILAGHIAPAEQWALLSKEWEQMLPFGTLADDGSYHFKMSEMGASPERMSRVPAFYRLIEKYVTVSISCRVNLADFANAKNRLKEATERQNIFVDFGDWLNPYFYSFRMLMDRFHAGREQLSDPIPLTENVDFYFDERLVEKKIIHAAWDGIMDSMPSDARKYYGSDPRFEDDRKFLPLQAADLWAWWVREWYEEDATELPDKMRDFDFGTWRGRKRKLFVMSCTEEDIFNTLRGVTWQASEVTLSFTGERF